MENIGEMMLYGDKSTAVSIHLPTTEQAQKEYSEENPNMESANTSVKRIAEKTVEVTNKEQLVLWEEYGLRLHIPHDALPDDCSHCTLKIAVSLSADFELPENGALVSAVYSFTHDLGNRKLKNKVTLEMQHCATNEALNGLRILRANCKSNKSKVIPAEIFLPDVSCGKIRLEHFSKFCVMLQNIAVSLPKSPSSSSSIVSPSQDESHSSSPTLSPMEYRVQVYYTDIGPKSFESNLYILPNLDANFEIIENQMKGRQYKGPSSIVELEDEKITVDIDPIEVTESGWKLDPLTSTMSSVGSSSPEKIVISCTWSKKESSIKQFHYRIKIKGTKNKEDILIVPSPSLMTALHLKPSDKDDPSYEDNPALHLKPSDKDDTSYQDDLKQGESDVNEVRPKKGDFCIHWDLWDVSRKGLKKKCGGSNICIAIIDTGINRKHAVFQSEGKIHPQSKSFVGSDLRDTKGHGTWCAGIAAGIQKDDFSGVAYAAELLICKVGFNPELNQVIEAFKYIKDITDHGTVVHIVSISFGFRYNCTELKTCIDQLTEKGIICVAATGNKGNHPIHAVHYPAKYDNVISVGAHTSLWNRALFSPDHHDVNYTTLGEGVCVPKHNRWFKHSFTYTDGTSMAAPAVAGLIACILEHHKNLEDVDNNKRINRIKEYLNDLTDDGENRALKELKALLPHKMFS